MQHTITNTANTITYKKGDRATVIIKRSQHATNKDRYTVIHYRFQENYENRNLRHWQRVGNLDYARKLARDWVNNV